MDVKSISDIVKRFEAVASGREGSLIKEVTWAAIDTAKKMAYANGDEAMGREAQAVLDYMKEHCIKLEDETHLISAPLRQSIRSFGEVAKISQTHKALLLRFYDFLMEREEGNRANCTATGINAYSKKEVNAHARDLATIQDKLEK